jgi:hypothetical protein
MAEPATIASVQAGYVDAGGARLLVRRWDAGARPSDDVRRIVLDWLARLD